MAHVEDVEMENGGRLITVEFQDGPMGITLRRRADDGIAFVFEIINDTQAIHLDVTPGDELWR
jgi:hypothetical protein